MEERQRESMEECQNNTSENQNCQMKSANKPKTKHRGWKVMPFIIGNEAFEKLGTIGTSANLLVYLTSIFHMKSITAANVMNIFNGTANFGTLIGAFLCDTYFGRYKTLAFCTCLSFLGLLVIQLTAAIHKLHPPTCAKNSTSCVEATAGQLTFLLSGFVLLIGGAGGIRPCNLAFGADQFNPETESGRKGIDSFFNWYVFTFTFAQMVSLTSIVYVQSNVSWSIGLAIPPVLMMISLALFLIGTKMYVKVPPSGSPLTSVAQVIAAAIRKRKLKQPVEPWLTLHNHINPSSINSELPYTNQFRCLNKAAIRTPEDQMNPDGSAANPWRLCTMQQVEEVKCLARVLPVWAAALVYHVPIVLNHTYATFQALQSDRRFGNTSFKIPAASYSVFQMLSLTIFVPIYDRIAAPLLRKLTGKEGGITVLQKIGVGMIISIVSMLVAASIERHRRHVALTEPIIGVEPQKGGISSMTGLLLIPQLSLAGLAEGFASTGQYELYYKQIPENMRSIGQSLFYCGLAGSSYLGSLLISIIHLTTKGAAKGDWLAEDLNKGRLDYFYYIIAALGVVNFGYFLLCASWFQYKGTNTMEVEIRGKKHEKATA